MYTLGKEIYYNLNKETNSMIDTRRAHSYSKDDISKIENYDKAVADTTQTWHLHHRDEVRILPSGMMSRRTKEELIENGRYYQCPANELIFLTRSEHRRLHMEGEKNSFYGQHHSETTRKKISESLKGRSISKEIRQKISEANKGKPHSAECRLNIAKAQSEIGSKYRTYKSNGGTMTYNEFRASIKKSC